MTASMIKNVLLYALASLGVTVAAQETASAPSQTAVTRPVLSQVRGLERVDGVLCAAARDYKVEFRADGIHYTCPLGKDAPESLPLSFELESVRVGPTELLGAGAKSEPRDDGWLVRYEHGAGVHELYEVRTDGIEQSFVLDELPAGGGDLVVRGRIATGLQLPAAGEYAGDLEFRSEDRGGVRFGEVLGIDAAGRKASGLLRFDGTHVEYVLPASFIAIAATPLVVDPLISSILTVYNAADGGDPDASYNDIADSYLVVFERQWSGTDVDVYAQRVSGAGALAGSLILLEPFPTPIAINPTVAYANGSNAWLVAWQQGTSILGPWDIFAKVVNSTGTATTPVALANTSANEIDPDAWGPRMASGSLTAHVVWDAHGAGIRGASVIVSSIPLLLVTTTYTVSTDPDDGKPAIARGGTDSTLVVWERFFTFPTPGDHDIAGVVLRSDGVLLTSVTSLLTSIGPDEQDLDVDGNGTDFALAYERRADLLGGTDSDIHCLRAKYNSSAGTLTVVGSAVAIGADASKNEIDPAIGFLGPKYALTWSKEVSALDYDLRMRLLDPADCTVCDGAEVAIASGATYTGRSEIAARRAAKVTPNAVSDDQALIVWETTATTFPFDGDIQAQQIEALGAGGAVVNVGGKCGTSGTIAYNGPASVGNPAVTITLTGADPAAAIGFINTAFGGTPLTCGACVWEPFSPLVAVRPVVGGSATYTAGVPCDPSLIGAKLRYQWTVAFTSVTPCPFSANISISDRIDATYGE